jgi:hypothetical protein
MRGFMDANVLVEKSTVFDPKKFNLGGVKGINSDAALTIMLKVGVALIH